MIHPTAKASMEINRKLPARNTTVQFLTLYTDPERHNAQRYRRTDRRHHDAKSRSYCVLKIPNRYNLRLLRLFV